MFVCCLFFFFFKQKTAYEIGWCDWSSDVCSSDLRRRLEAERLQVERQVALVENTQHDLLAEQHGQRRDAEIDDAGAHLELDAPVLRHAALGDVELRHDLDARREGRAHLHRRLHHFVQRAVHAVADTHLVLERLDMDVGGAALYGVGEESVDQLDDRRIVGQVLRLDVLVLLVLDDLEVFRRLDRLQQGLELGIRLLVVALDGVAQRVLAGDDGKDVAAGDELDVLDRRDVVRIGNGDRQGSSLPLQGEDRVLGGDVGGEELDDLGVDLEPRQVDGRHPVLPGQHLADLGFLDKAKFYQGIAQAHPGVLLLQEGLPELLQSDETFPNQDLAELVLGDGDTGR